MVVWLRQRKHKDYTWKRCDDPDREMIKIIYTIDKTLVREEIFAVLDIRPCTIRI